MLIEGTEGKYCLLKRYAHIFEEDYEAHRQYQFPLE